MDRSRRTGMELLPGDEAPDFAVADQSGKLHRLADCQVRTVVLWFYPKADTPGCTAEACGFRELLPAFTARDVVILGASFDPPEANAAFVEKYELPFPLLCDTSRALGLAYGACTAETDAVQKRIAVVIGKDGRLEQVHRQVDPRSFPTTVLATLSK